ncbi:MAG: DUF2065 domain-containing protein [Zoogloeaceae bacterium]|jgi:uncharacterized protein YjeT (DUF2065 family)|nr:DUF2065 domain-containing protein [Zoogloeaceae bacterium]
MTLSVLILAFALMLFIEGLLPLLAPGLWREAFIKLTRFADGQLRFVGLLSVAAGGLLFFFCFLLAR